MGLRRTALQYVIRYVRSGHCRGYRPPMALDKVRAPYEFVVKVSIATTNRRCKGGQFVLHAKALLGNPYDGHTLAAVNEETETLTGREIERIYEDKGYRGHDAPKPNRVFRSDQKRGVFGAIKRERRRRSAIEAVIGYLKTDDYLGRNFLKGHHGDHANAVPTAAAETLITIAADPRHLGARIGLTAVLHTWGSALTHHPHVHCVVPGGGISPDGSH